MTLDNAKRIFMETARLYLGVPYRWGGDNVFGIDCSGLVIECLRAVGRLGNNFDTTANGLWKMYYDLEVDKPQEGDLIFWFNTKGIATHVAICYIDDYCITADGGGSFVENNETAEAYNAFVKFRPISHRKNKPKYVRLF